MDLVAGFAISIVSLVVGALIAWMMSRNREAMRVQTAIGQAQKAYDAAHSKLAIGKGNIIRQAEMLRDMGVKPSKESCPTRCEPEGAGVLSPSLVESTSADDEAIVIPGGLIDASVALGIG